MRTTKPLIMLTATLLLLCASYARAKPNFSGHWKLNADKSDFGMMPAPTSLEQNITHNDPQLKVVRTQKGEMGEFHLDASYTTDGKECVNKTQMGEIRSTLKWDGETLVIESKMDFQGDPFTITDRWILSEDGKTLTMNRHFSGSQGEGDAKVVLDKQ